VCPPSALPLDPRRLGTNWRATRPQLDCGPQVRHPKTVLGTTIGDCRAFADVLERVRERGRVVVTGSPETIVEANTARGNWLEVAGVF
jgi:hypothetical protein